MDKSHWLLSPQALPKVEIPVSPHDSVRRFRMPSCIGRSPAVDVQRIEAAASSDARFGDRTLAFFNVGDELEREAEAAELEAIELTHPLVRRAVPIAAAGAALGLVLAFVLT